MNKALFSFLLSFMLLTAIYADGVAAWPGESLVNKVKSTLSSVKDKIVNTAKSVKEKVQDFLYEHKISVSIGVGGASAIAAILLAPETMGLSLVALLAAGAFATGAGITYTFLKETGPATTKTDNYNAEQLADQQNLHAYFSNYLKNTTDAQVKSVMEVANMFRSDFTEYSFESSDDSVGTGEITFKIWGPDKIYGYSVFPVKIELRHGDNPEVKDPVYIKKVTILLRDADGNIPSQPAVFDFGSYNDGKGYKLEGNSLVLSTLLKAPDPYLNKISNFLNGYFNEDLLKEIVYNATLKEFEIEVYVEGKREVWIKENGQEIHDHDEPINIKYTTTSAWKHYANDMKPVYYIDGAEGSLSLVYKDFRKMFAYREVTIGAISNFLTGSFASPVHVKDSTADFRFIIIPFYENFNGVYAHVVDDYRALAVRFTTAGPEVADMVPRDYVGQFGELEGTKYYDVTLSLTYHDTPDTVSYDVYFVLVADIERADGVKLPVWLIIKPYIAVEEKHDVSAVDNTNEKIKVFYSDGKISEEELQQLKAEILAFIDSIDRTKAQAEEWKEKNEAKGNDEGVEYANKALDMLDKAKKYAQRAYEEDNPDKLVRYFAKARSYYYAAIKYIEASRLSWFGIDDQAEAEANAAEKIEQSGDDISTTTGLPGQDFINKVRDWLHIPDEVPDFIVWLILAVLIGVIAMVVLNVMGKLGG